MIKVISNYKIAKVCVPLFFITPSGSQAIDIMTFLAFFDKNLEKVVTLVQRAKDNYEELIWEMVNGNRTENDKLLEEIEINIETVDEREYEEKIKKAFKKHKILLDIFEVKKPEGFYFILFRSKFFIGSFEGFKKPIVVCIFDRFYDILILRSYLLWSLINEKRIKREVAEVILDYVVWLKYRLKIGEITKKQFEKFLDDYKKRKYWLFKTFGDWIDKLDFLLDYDFKESVWAYIKRKNKHILEELSKEIIIKSNL